MPQNYAGYCKRCGSLCCAVEIAEGHEWLAAFTVLAWKRAGLTVEPASDEDIRERFHACQCREQEPDAQARLFE